MDNLPVKAKDKKLNIFQRIRLEIFKRRKFTIDRYINAPEFIKEDDTLIDYFYASIYGKEDLSQNILQIPDSKLEELLINRRIDLKAFSKDKQIEFVKKHPELIPNDTQEAFILIDKIIQNKEYSVISLFSKHQSEYLNYLKEKGTLNENLPNILKHLHKDIIDVLISKKGDLISYLDQDQQVKYVEKDIKYLKFTDEKVQSKFIEQNEEYIKFVSQDMQNRLVQDDINNFKKTSIEFQLKMLAYKPKLYDYSSTEVQEKIWNTFDYELVNNARCSLLKKDIGKSKFFSGKGINKEGYISIFDKVENEDIETIKILFLHSKLMSAKGKLIPNYVVLHGISEAGVLGMDDYSNSQINIIKRLDDNQIEELITIDSNYILPYLAGNRKGLGTIQEGFYVLDEEETKYSKMKCQKLFEDIYGNEKFYGIEECINAIYDLQNIENQRLKNATMLIGTGISMESPIAQKKLEMLRSLENVPLNQFKILFNQAIINNNPEEIIKQYFSKMSLGEDNSEEFRSMIENAYGPRARAILESRPELNVHNINSLEVFDSRIVDNFGEAFVHDAISYNLRDFSGFLDIIKDENKLESFKTYYNVLTSVMGHNVETMQKAISEYIYNEEILENVKEIELTEKQYDNLISVLCSKDNRYDIKTLQDLQNFDEIANKKIREQLTSVQTAEEIKKIISERILGLDYEVQASYELGNDKRESLNEQLGVRNYGETINHILTLYNISTEIGRESIYTEEQLEILQVMNFIHEEKDPVKLKQLAEELMSQRGIKNPVITYDTINKIKEHQIELFNESLLSADSMEELVKREERKDNPLITKSIQDGVTKYSLEGIEFRFLIHDTGNIQNARQYEGQLGNSAICCRLITDKNIGGNLGRHGFTRVDKIGGVITYYSGDGGTTHLPKMIKNTGKINRKIGEDLIPRGNEVAIYRRNRNHDDISNDNMGGRCIQDVYITYSDDDISEYSEEFKQYLRENNIPVVYINKEKYEELQKKQEHEDDKKQEVSDEGR